MANRLTYGQDFYTDEYHWSFDEDVYETGGYMDLAAEMMSSMYRVKNLRGKALFPRPEVRTGFASFWDKVEEAMPYAGFDGERIRIGCCMGKWR